MKKFRERSKIYAIKYLSKFLMTLTSNYQILVKSLTFLKTFENFSKHVIFRNSTLQGLL